MQIHYIAQAYQNVSNAGTKPSKDFEDVLRNLGAKNVGLPRIITQHDKLWWLWTKASAILAVMRMPKNQIIVIQYPEQPLIRRVVGSAKKRGNRLITLVHDINELRGFPSNIPDIFVDSDVIISHTPAMSKWLQSKYHIQNIVELGIFDYMGEHSVQRDIPFDHNDITVVFAGRLDKSPFLQKISMLNRKIHFILYGLGLPEQLKEIDNIDYKGACLPDELPEKISRYNFGLVWDGDATDCCSGLTGQYLRYNAPYKLSSYIASGIPVIIWDKMATADFVRKNGIGVSINSLSDLERRLTAISKEEYREMRNNVAMVGERIRKGYYYRKAVESSVEYIL